MVTFKAYADRRGLTIENFQHLQYEEYLSWCSLRKIKPVERIDFETDQSVFKATHDDTEYTTSEEMTLEPEIILEPVTTSVQVNPIKWDRINKKRKSDIQAMCTMRGIEFEDATKKQLISMLKEFEGIE